MEATWETRDCRLSQPCRPMSATTPDSVPLNSISSAPALSPNPVGASLRSTSACLHGTAAVPAATPAAVRSTSMSGCSQLVRAAEGSGAPLAPPVPSELIHRRLTNGRPDSAAIGELAAYLGWSNRQVREHAIRLGVLTRRTVRPNWEPAEVEMLEHLARAGRTDAEIQAMMRGQWAVRSLHAIGKRRRQSGIRLTGKALSEQQVQMRRKHWPTDATDESMRRIFRESKGRGAYRLCVEALGWSLSAVRLRAMELGLARQRGAGSARPWTDDEDALLQKFGFQSVDSLRLRLKTDLGAHRSDVAIACRLGYLRVRGDGEGMGVNALASALGVAVRTILRWLERGEIRAIVRYPELQAIGHHRWWFPRAEIRRFVIAHAEAIDLVMVEKTWFIDLLTGGRNG